MNHEIFPYEGVDQIKFGMLPSEVRHLIDQEFKSFKRTPTAAHPCDYFPRKGVTAYYKASGALEALEFASPAQPILEGMNFLTLEFNTARAFLRSMDPALEIESDGAVSHALGVALFAPISKPSPQAKCESVFVFERGYYD